MDKGKDDNNAPQPTDGRYGVKTCELDGCSVIFAVKTKNQKYCCHDHRALHWQGHSQKVSESAARQTQELADECSRCKYWNQDQSFEVDGECRFNAPIAIRIRQGQSHASPCWPIMPDYGWCGRFEEKGQ